MFCGAVGDWQTDLELCSNQKPDTVRGSRLSVDSEANVLD